MICFQRDAVDTDTPGCSGTADGIKDYCIVPPTSPASQETCILIKTGFDTYDNGYLNVFVNTGAGYFEVIENIPTTEAIIYNQGEVVLDECYLGLVGVQVTNIKTNAWAGSIESSVNNRTSYSPMLCLDCTGIVDTTEYIVIDGDGNGIGDTTCHDGITGNYCTLINVATFSPTPSVTDSPTISPVEQEITVSPTSSPISSEPTASPSSSPVTAKPTASPSLSPSGSPTDAPSTDNQQAHLHMR